MCYVKTMSSLVLLRLSNNNYLDLEVSVISEMDNFLKKVLWKYKKYANVVFCAF